MNLSPLTCVGEAQPLNIPIVWESAPKYIDDKLNTSEFVYRLNLPSIEERFNDKGKKLLNISAPVRKAYSVYPVDKVFKSEWVNWHGLIWTDIVRFYKDNYIGRIHDDGHCDKWGINWVLGGYATVSFWNLSKINDIISVNDEQNLPIKVYTTVHPPCKHYIMPPGAYLFNAGVPHLPAGYNKRLLFSLRSKNMPWDQVVNHFSKFI